METNRTRLDEDALNAINSNTLEQSGIFGRIEPVEEEPIGYEDLEDLVYEFTMLARERSFVSRGDDEPDRQRRMRDDIAANAASSDPLRPSYFVRNPGL